MTERHPRATARMSGTTAWRFNAPPGLAAARMVTPPGWQFWPAEPLRVSSEFALDHRPDSG